MFITNMKFIYKFQLYIFSICFYSTQKGVTLSHSLLIIRFT